MALFHLTLRHVSRRASLPTGKCRRGSRRARVGTAQLKLKYITRQGAYAERKDCLHIESVNMPAWVDAKDVTSRDYWSAADEFERANGRLLLDLEFALPRELGLEQNIELVRTFVESVSTVVEGHLPGTWALHDKGDGNPHVHLMLSERACDGHDRSRTRWFRRAVPSGCGSVAGGGAAKARSVKGDHWLAEVRATWAQLQNDALARAGSASWVSHLSLEAQGTSRRPQAHMGPVIASLLSQGREGDFGTVAASLVAHNRAIRAETEVARLQTKLSTKLRRHMEFQRRLALAMRTRRGSPQAPADHFLESFWENLNVRRFKPTYRVARQGGTNPTGHRGTAGLSVQAYSSLRTLSGIPLASHGQRLAEELLPSDVGADLESRREASTDQLRRVPGAVPEASAKARTSGRQGGSPEGQSSQGGGEAARQSSAGGGSGGDASHVGSAGGKNWRQGGEGRGTAWHQVRGHDALAVAPPTVTPAGGYSLVAAAAATATAARRSTPAHSTRYRRLELDHETRFLRNQVETAFVARGNEINLELVDEEAVEVALAVAAEKWSGIIVRGDTSFKRLVARVAGRLGLSSIVFGELERTRAVAVDHPQGGGGSDESGAASSMGTERGSSSALSSPKRMRPR